MKIIYSVIFALMLIMCSSCEQIVSDVSLPYKEQLVIRAIIQPGLHLQDFTLTRTLHPLDDYNKEKALVKDAAITISDGTNNYTLTYDGKNYVNDQILFEAGKTYSMTAQWKNLKATSKTTIPQTIEIEEITYEKQINNYGYYIDTSYVIYGIFTPQPGVVYKTAYHELERPKYLRYSWEIYTYNNRNAQGKVKAYIVSIGAGDKDDTYIQNYIRQLAIHLFAYDEPFLNYHNTRHHGESDIGFFGSEGLNILWNIEGDGIGLFIGMNHTIYRK